MLHDFEPNFLETCAVHIDKSIAQQASYLRQNALSLPDRPSKLFLQTTQAMSEPGAHAMLSSPAMRRVA